MLTPSGDDGDERPERGDRRRAVDAVAAGAIERLAVAVGGGDELQALALRRAAARRCGRDRRGYRDRASGEPTSRPGRPRADLERAEQPAVGQRVPGEAEADRQRHGDHARAGGGRSARPRGFRLAAAVTASAACSVVGPHCAAASRSSASATSSSLCAASGLSVGGRSACGVERLVAIGVGDDERRRLEIDAEHRLDLDIGVGVGHELLPGDGRQRAAGQVVGRVVVVVAEPDGGDVVAGEAAEPGVAIGDWWCRSCRRPARPRSAARRPVPLVDHGAHHAGSCSSTVCSLRTRSRGASGSASKTMSPRSVRDAGDADRPASCSRRWRTPHRPRSCR